MPPREFLEAIKNEFWSELGRVIENLEMAWMIKPWMGGFWNRFSITRPNEDYGKYSQIETKYFRVSRNHVIFAGLRSMTNDQVAGVV